MITSDIARALALALPEAEEQAHFDKPSFRVRGKIFATLWLEERRAVLKLAADDQAALLTLDPQVFASVPGAWGAHGWTSVYLDHVDAAQFAAVLITAWRQVAPKRIVAAHAAQQ